MLRKANVLRYHDTSGASRPSKDESRQEYLENTGAKSLVYTANTRFTSHRPGSPSISTPTDTRNTPTGNSSVFSVGLQEVFKASSSLSKLVSTSIFGSDQNAAKPLTYYESHEDDHEIANYVQEEDSDQELRTQPTRIDGETEILDWQEDISRSPTSSPSLHQRKTTSSSSSSFLPLNKLAPSRAPATSPHSNSYCQDEDDEEDSFDDKNSEI